LFRAAYYQPIPIIFQQLNSTKWPQFCDHSVTSADVRLSVGPNSKSCRLPATVDLASPPARTSGPSERNSPLTVAVGTTITDRPPHRSVRARLRIRLLRRMSGVEACIGIGVQKGWRNPPVQDWGEAFPPHLCALTTA